MEEFENQHPKPLSVKDWLVTLLLMAIPVVGIVLLFVYAFGSNENPTAKLGKSTTNYDGNYFCISHFHVHCFWFHFAAAMATQN